MKKERKNPDCINVRIVLCGEARKIVQKRQAEALVNTGAIISMETAINKLLIENCK